MAGPWEQYQQQGPQGPWSAYQGAEPSVPFFSGDAAQQTTGLEALGYNAADSLSLGFGDELAGTVEGLKSLSEGGDYISAYRKRVDEARARLEAARAEHPWISLAGAGLGAIPLALVTGGAGEAVAARAGLGALTRAAAGRGLTAVGARGALGAIGGGIGGGIYGFGAGDGDLGQRGPSALATGLGGAALGAVSPALFGGLGASNPFVRTATGGVVGAGGALMTGQDPIAGLELGAAAGLAGRPVLGAAKRIFKSSPVQRALGYEGPTERPYRTNALLGGFYDDVIKPALRPSSPEELGVGGSGGGGGNMRSAIEPEIPESAIRDIDRAMGSEQYGVDELAGRVAAAEAKPLGRTLADVGGEQFLAKADALANLPGQTGPVAKRIAEERARALPTQIEEDLKTRLGVTKTPYKASMDLDEQMRANGGVYEAVTEQAPKPEVIAGQINPMIKDDPLFQNALMRVMRYENRAASAAARSGQQPLPKGVMRNADGDLELSPNAPGKTLHLLKMAFDDEIGAGKARTDVSSIGKFEASEVGRLRDEFLDAIDKALPGYTAVRKTAGGLFEQQEALELGKKALSMSKSDVREIMAKMSSFEKDQFRIAVAENAVDRLEGASGAVSFRNAANAFERNKIQNVFREIFDSPDQAEEFLAIVNERNRLMRNASGWIGNSATVRRAAQAADQGLAQMADMGAQVATGNPIGALGTASKSAYNALIGRVLEARNNKTGNALLSIIDADTPEQRAFNIKLLAELRKLEEGRIARARAAFGEGAQGAVGGGAIRDQQEGY